MAVEEGGLLLEREIEQTALADLIEAAMQGDGRIAVIEGAAGIGKSALLASAVETATEFGMRVLSARGSELEREFAFGTVRELFEPVIASASADERDALLEGAAGSAERAIATDVAASQAQIPPGGTFAVLHGIYWLASNLAERGPLLIAIDDVHLSDTPSLRALNHLAKRIGDLPIALVVALRPAEPDAPQELLDQLRDLPDCLGISLGPLGPISDRELVRLQFPEAEEEFCDACHEASAGNPFYLRELLHTLAADGVGPDAEGTREVGAVSIPTIGARLIRRIARVAVEATVLASAMAVIGDGGRLSDAEALAGLDRDVAARTASKLVRMQVLAGADPFSFVHPLVRASVLGEMTVAQIDAAHSAAAGLARQRGAAPEVIATHLQAQRPAGSVEVVEAMRAAAAGAMARAAPETAIGYLRRAVAEEADLRHAGALLHELAEAEIAVGDSQAVGHLRGALESTQEPSRRARITTDLFELLSTGGRWEAAEVLAKGAEAEFGESHPDVVATINAQRAGTMAFEPDRVGEFDANLERYQELARRDSPIAQGLALVLASVQCFRGERLDEVGAIVERGFNTTRLVEQGAHTWALPKGLSALVGIDELDLAEAHCNEVLSWARATGSAWGLLAGGAHLAWIHIRRGDLVAAQAETDSVLELGEQNDLLGIVRMGNLILKSLAPVVSADYADVIYERREFEWMAQVTDSTIELIPQLDPWRAETRAIVRLHHGKVDGAIDDLRVASAQHQAVGFGPLAGSWRSRLALTLPREQRDEALDLAREELALSRATGIPRPIGKSLRALGLLEGGTDGIELLRESVTTLSDSPARLELARSQLELGAALRRGNQRADAREHLAAAMELAQRCGASRLGERAREELRATGARPRRVMRTGVDSLTPSELRVARLAATGASNPEIAQELYLSLKTVEMHLSSSYSKLDVSGRGARTRLAEALETQAATGSSGSA